MRIFVAGLITSIVVAALGTPRAEASAPGSMEITCDVERRTFRTLAKNETQVTFRLWDAQTGGSQCGPDNVVLMKDLKVFNSKTDQFDAQKPRRFASIRAIVGSDASPIQICSGVETWLDIAVGTTTLTCDFSADDDPKNPPPPPARKRLQSVPFAQQPSLQCPPDSVRVGSVCLDRYEASVWDSPTGTMQYGLGSANYPCTANGQNCTNIYARSVAGVIPSAYATWFQAQQACANVGKRLPTNAEWQQAVAGSPDPGPDNGTTDCRTTGVSPVTTGSRSNCVSTAGAFDMVGNVEEWVADWVPLSTGCPNWGPFSNDYMCLSGASTTATDPGALLRGGDFLDGPLAGPLTLDGSNRASGSFSDTGFRCAR